MNSSLQAAAVPFRLERGRHAAVQVFEHLRESIISMSLLPGATLSRPELAQQYDVSQTPVRDALIRLAEEGLVEVYAQHATVVSRVDVALAQQAQFLRRALEVEIARVLAASATPALVDRLRSLIARQEAMLQVGDMAEFSLADQAFHRQMYEAAHAPDLWSIVRRQSGHLDRLRRLHLPIEGKAQAVVKDHKAIVDAIASGDAAKAEACVRKHLSGTLMNLEEIRSRYADFLK